MLDSNETKLKKIDAPDPEFVEHYMKKYEHFRIPKAVLMEVIARKNEHREVLADPTKMIPYKLRALAFILEAEDQRLSRSLEEYLAYYKEMWAGAQQILPKTTSQDELIYWADMMEGVSPSLVKAAPDVLEALKMLVESTSRADVGPPFAYDNAVAIINKVEASQ